jgi:hypothetical protein
MQRSLHGRSAITGAPGRNVPKHTAHRFRATWSEQLYPQRLVDEGNCAYGAARSVEPLANVSEEYAFKRVLGVLEAGSIARRIAPYRKRSLSRSRAGGDVLHDGRNRCSARSQAPFPARTTSPTRPEWAARA